MPAQPPNTTVNRLTGERAEAKMGLLGHQIPTIHTPSLGLPPCETNAL
jgi:hypothetical protein